MLIVCKSMDSEQPVFDLQKDHFILYEYINGEIEETIYYLRDENRKDALGILHWLIDNGDGAGIDTHKSITGRNVDMSKTCTLTFTGNASNNGVNLKISVVLRPVEYNVNNVYVK